MLDSSSQSVSLERCGCCFWKDSFCGAMTPAAAAAAPEQQNGLSSHKNKRTFLCLSILQVARQLAS